MNPYDHEDRQSFKAIENNDITALRNQLDYFIRLSQAQKEQIKNYKAMQQRSQRLIQSLINRTAQQQSWKKDS